MQSTNEDKAAAIVSGAAAKGAFAAGALRVLAERGIKLARLVGTSAGAINAAAYAAGVRAGNELVAARRMEQLWIDRGNVLRVFDFDPRSIIRARGLADHDRLLALLREEIRPALTAQADVGLVITAATLRGRVERLASGEEVTTYEHVERFAANAFDDSTGIERVLDAALASASLPVAFVPRYLATTGPCVDGGLVNNTPVAEALRDPSIRTIYVISPLPARDDRVHPSLAWVLQRVLDIALNERLFRDLMRADRVNMRLSALQALVANGTLTEAQRDHVLAALSWQGRRELQVIQIRPKDPLRGDYVRGFFSKDLRREYVDAGCQAAQAELDKYGVRGRAGVPSAVIHA